MQEHNHAPVVSFVIRLWVERRDVAAAPEWRFRVQHVQSGEGLYVRTLADLLTFVERQSGLTAPPLSDDPSHAERRDPDAAPAHGTGQ